MNIHNGPLVERLTARSVFGKDNQVSDKPGIKIHLAELIRETVRLAGTGSVLFQNGSRDFSYEGQTWAEFLESFPFAAMTYYRIGDAVTATAKHWTDSQLSERKTTSAGMQCVRGAMAMYVKQLYSQEFDGVKDNFTKPFSDLNPGTVELYRTLAQAVFAALEEKRKTAS